MNVAVKDFLKHFPHEKMRDTQEKALEKVASSEKGVILEMPTGSGKTAVGITVLKTMAKKGSKGLFYITPTKTLVDQIRRLFPNDVTVILGRAEYQCLYYSSQGILGINAEESPCYMLKCPHRVDQETGKVCESGVEPCPYFKAKHEAKKRAEEGGIVLCTTAFFLKNRLTVEGWRDNKPDAVVIDEVHRLAKIARDIFSYTLTDYHLGRVAKLVAEFDEKQAEIIKKFNGRFRQIARRRISCKPSLLKIEEVESLIKIMENIDDQYLEKKIREAVDAGKINPVEQKGDLKTLENFITNIPRLIRSLCYATDLEKENPLNYVVAFYYTKDDPEFAGTKRKARYFLTIKSYFVIPIIRRVLGKKVIAYSATIGDSRIFSFETGIKLPFFSFPSMFPIEQAKIFMPTDTKNLAVSRRRRGDLSKSLRLVVETSLLFAKKGCRSLVVVVSEEERQKFLQIAGEKGLEAISYGNGIKPREAAAKFSRGEGQVLVGTAANYSEGVDFPKKLAPVIFFLRPGYQRPDDPETQFEERRFTNGQVWALRNWRVMLEALQVRGRNIRGAEDIGVCFFISQQFRNFLYTSMPEWLKPAYSGQLTMEGAVKEAMKLLK
ncbi:MAG: helicase C-terminal domain-containing protein [Patescibacteria group bacterium]|nr:helicase C-terminal domain-containing protein [Patescibacteria group bacterium]MDD5490999.1 helicase C-terminal domain-containing protein [Patescibacteria group bacterium]